jgi:hypothetical protein
MDSSRLGRGVRRYRRSAGRAVAVALALVLGGCGASYVEDGQASVLLIVADVNGGAVLDSDVRLGPGSTLICPDTVDVAVAVRHKNPNALAPSVPNAVIIERYDIRYFRSDTSGVEGIDVPYRVSGLITTAVDVADSGTVAFPIEVVRRQAKLEPPLSGIAGFDIVTVIAEITIYGRTVSGDAVAGTGRLQIDFADYGDEETSCPSQS